MAFNETLNNRIREALAEQENVEEKYMFGGVCYMVNSKMCVGIIKDDMMCRINPELLEDALDKPGSRLMDFSGKPMKGFVFVDINGLKKQSDFDYWIKLCLDYNPLAKASKKKLATKK